MISNKCLVESRSPQGLHFFYHWRDYLELCKPKVVLLMLLTSFIGMLLAVDNALPSITLMILGNLGIALCAGSAATINHLVDRHVDIKMARTHNRPVAKGRITPRQALGFAGALAMMGTSILYLVSNGLATGLTVGALFGYAVIYTLYLKRATPQNIVIGGIAGAAPPLLGWVAVTGHLDAEGLLLALIIFVWTPPHFWALAIHRKDEYAKADIPMLPVTHGIAYTKLHVLLYSFILLAVSLLPYTMQMMGWFYLLGATALGIGFIYYAGVLLLSAKAQASMDVFKYSIVYLMSLFAIMLADHYWIMAEGAHYGY